MSRVQKITVFGLTALVVVAPLFALAQGLVPCGRNVDGDPATTLPGEAPCTLCHFFVLGQNIIKFLMWTAAPVLAVLGLTWGGFKILVSGANPGLRQDGFRIMKTVLWGLLIVFGAWIIINELLLFFASPPGTTGTARVLQNPWNTIQCR